MERKVYFSVFAVGLCAMLNSAQAQTIASYSEVGGTLSLSPPFSGVITSILWKHDTDLVVELVRNEMDYYGKFVGVATLDNTTARLEIKNMSEVYAGLYTVEINNQVQSQSYNVSVIKKVPRPEVAFKPLACTAFSENCNLTCDGDTSEAGPVTYSWREGDGGWIQGEKDKSIKNNDKTIRVKTFSCQMKNPVSEKESEPQGNPFFQEISESSDGGKIAGGVIGLLAILGLAGLAGLAYWKREPIKDFIDRRRTQAAPATENGRTADSSPNEEHPLNEERTKDVPSDS